MDILEESKQYKKDANRILKDTGLTLFLRKFGKLTFEGSYSYNLMYGGDIDLHLKMDSLNYDHARDIFKKLVDDNRFSMYQFTNFYDDGRFSEAKRVKNGFPKGYYIGLGYWLEGEKWKIDTWLSEKENVNSKIYKQLIAEKLTDDNKRLILEIKKFSIRNKLKIPGIEIYNAVLREDVKSLIEFRNNYEI